MRQTTKGLTLGTLLLSAQLLSPLAMASAELPGRVRVQPLQSSLPEEAFQSLLVSKLMARLGYDVQPAQEVDYNVAYASVAQGDGTFLAFNWVPLQDNKYEQAGATRCSSVRAPMWPVPPRVPHRQEDRDPIRHHQPGPAQRIPRWRRCLTGMATARPTSLVATRLGLRGGDQPSPRRLWSDPTVAHKQGNYAALIADTLARYQAGKPVLYYTWTLLAQQRTGAGAGCGVAGSPADARMRLRPVCRTARTTALR